MLPTTERGDEVRRLLELGPEALDREAGDRVSVLGDLDELFEQFAQAVADEIAASNDAGERTTLILPVGPVDHYPRLAELINEREIDMADCHLFFMDEYCDHSGRVVPPDHPLSFRREMDAVFFDHLDPALAVPDDQVVFPTHENVTDLPGMIADAGGIDTCYGGIGVHGHVAFNEPEPGVADTDPRLVYLNDYTRTINAIRAGVGGNLEGFPRKAVTVGMNQVLGADRVRLYCRNDVPGLDWANTVLRLAVLGDPGPDYPVTYLTDHDDYRVVTDERTAARPDHVL
ncbi:6-phosphogluconolactonase [Haloarcula pelagica]|uniref:6-phosphogluconolactonase n=2 Tax=Haloarcula TaxID=2237 RepID=UPI0024C39F99|nr:6-phosphogluconolactonase [Halomicroarcula sp. YJ-61-S]